MLVGTFDGHLMKYVVKEDKERHIALQLLHIDENFSENPIDKMDAVAECQLLFSLTKAQVRIHRICDSGLKYVMPLVREHASLFAWNLKRSIHSADLIIRICVAIGQKVQIWNWNFQKDILSSYEEAIELDSTVTSIAWWKNSICVAIETGYKIYDVIISIFIKPMELKMKTLSIIHFVSFFQISTPRIAKEIAYLSKGLMEMEAHVSVVWNCFAVAKDGKFIAVNPRNGQTFMDPIQPNEHHFQSVIWSNPIHHLGNYIVVNWAEVNSII